MGFIKFTRNDGKVYDSRGNSTYPDDNGDRIPMKGTSDDFCPDEFKEFLKQPEEGTDGQTSGDKQNKSSDQKER